MNGQAHLRIARPTRDIDAAEDFWAQGLALEVLYRHTPTTSQEPEEHRLLMLGWTSAAWHLELVQNMVTPVEPTPTPEDLLILYLGGPVSDALVDRLETHGGTRTTAHNPYWDRWGVTIADPDGYRLVLSTRTWNNAQALARTGDEKVAVIASVCG